MAGTKKTIWRIEWPPGSGRVARYSDADVAQVQEIVDWCEAGKISQRELGAAVEAIHEAKMTGGGFKGSELLEPPGDGSGQLSLG